MKILCCIDLATIKGAYAHDWKLHEWKKGEKKSRDRKEYNSFLNLVFYTLKFRGEFLRFVCSNISGKCLTINLLEGVLKSGLSVNSKVLEDKYNIKKIVVHEIVPIYIVISFHLSYILFISCYSE